MLFALLDAAGVEGLLQEAGYAKADQALVGSGLFVTISVATVY